LRVRIQGERQVLDWPVRDGAGRRLGRVVGVECDPDPYTAAWLLLRLPGWPRRLRAVPASGANWQPGGPLSVAYRREVVLASPAPSRHAQRTGFVGRELEQFYRSAGS
jgi:hypothetical protein